MSGFPDVAGVTVRPTGILVERAVACLSRGPCTTPTLAAEVLALRGNPRAAAAAVFALLGSDPRFDVNAAGEWSLATLPPTAAVPFALEEFVVVDVETTGGSPAHGHRVIEIAAVRVRAGKVLEHYATLVDPGRPIPRMISSLTGITGDMVAGAPRFEGIAAHITGFLSDRVFVGHNASFDWRFVTAEVERATGGTLAGRQLCTLRLARRLLPHLPSRSLGALADYFGVPMDAHHRALDDAVATARLLLRLLEMLEERGVTGWEDLERFFSTPSRRRPRLARPQSMDAA